jgi:hypothetical protein
VLPWQASSPDPRLAVAAHISEAFNRYEAKVAVVGQEQLLRNCASDARAISNSECGTVAGI